MRARHVLVFEGLDTMNQRHAEIEARELEAQAVQQDSDTVRDWMATQVSYIRDPHMRKQLAPIYTAKLY